MKKFICLIVSILFISVLFSSCDNKVENKDVVYKSGIYDNKNWDESIGTYVMDVIPDEETALKTAEAIFNGMEKSETAQEYVPQSVYYDEQDGIWIISFWQESDEATLGNDCNIAMQKKDGKVLRIWFGE